MSLETGRGAPTSLDEPLETIPGLLAPYAVARDERGRAVLMGGRCAACGQRMFPRHPVCPACMAENVEPETMPRTGALYAYSTVHVGPKKWNKPFTIGYVDLPNAVRVFTHLKGPVRIGGLVELDIAEVGREADGAPIVRFVFKPAEA